MQRVFNFSGGRTSAYMVIHYWKPGDLVIFCDTGREHPKTYKFINDFEAHEGIPVIRLRYNDSESPFDALLEKKKYKVIPNMRKRICTVELKIRLCKRYLKSIGIIRFENFIGFRSDEPLRVNRHVEQFKKVQTMFPLFRDGINKPMIVHYFKSKPYDLEIPSILGNCTLCFMKGKNAIMIILSVYPELADPWINDEEKSLLINGKANKKGTSGRQYFPDVTMRQLRDLAQNNLFKDKIDLSQLTPAFDCTCTP